MDYKKLIPEHLAKKVTAADHKMIERIGIAKFINENFHEGVNVDEKGLNPHCTARNPLTRWEKVTTPLLFALVHFVQEISYHNSYRKFGLTETNWLQNFDRARYLILKLDDEIYSNVID